MQKDMKKHNLFVVLKAFVVTFIVGAISDSEL